MLGCLSERDYALLVNGSLGYNQAYSPGSVISICVRRNGLVQHVKFVAQSGPPVPNTYGSNALSALRVLVVVLFIFTGIALVMARPSLMTWIFYAYCLANAPSFAAQENWTVLPAWQYAIAAGIPGFGTTIAVSLLLLFSILVPDDRIPSGWRRTAFYLASIIAVADIALGVVVNFYTGMTISQSVVNALTKA